MEAAVRKITGWDYMHEGWQGVYEVGPQGANLISHVQLSPAEKAVSIQEMTARGVRQAFLCAGGPAVWSFDDQGGDIWSREQEIACSRGQELMLRGRAIATIDIVDVVSFLDADDLGYRGVRLTLRNGESVSILAERDETAQLDPTYNVDNARIDGAWAGFLGIDLANWLEVPHRDDRG